MSISFSRTKDVIPFVMITDAWAQKLQILQKQAGNKKNWLMETDPKKNVIWRWIFLSDLGATDVNRAVIWLH